VVPKPQGAGFNNFGFDQIIPIIKKVMGKDRVEDIKVVQGVTPANPNGTPVTVSSAAIALPSTATSAATATLPVTGSNATATSKYSVNAVAADGSLSGNVSVDGNYKAASAGSAFSYSRVDVFSGLGLKNGKANIFPQLNAASFISPQTTSFGKEPVFFQVLDLDGNILNGDKLLDITYEIDGLGSLSWNGSSFSISATDAALDVEENSDFVASAGSLHLRIQNGIFTAVTDTLKLLAMDPVVGSPGTFSTTTLPNISFDYDVSSVLTADAANISVDFDAGAGISAVPEPPAILCVAIGTVMMIVLWRRKQPHMARA
jgi:hypothetical protein